MAYLAFLILSTSLTVCFAQNGQIGSHQFNQNLHGASEGYGNTIEDKKRQATDAELREMNNYVDPLLVQENYQKACAQASEELDGKGRQLIGKKIKFEEGQDICNSDAEALGEVFGGQWDAMVTVASQMIPLVLGSMGMGSSESTITFMNKYERAKLKRDKSLTKQVNRIQEVTEEGNLANLEQDREYLRHKKKTHKHRDEMNELTEEGKTGSGKGEKKEDYCKFIPIASQFATGAMQGMQAEETMLNRPEPQPGDVQRDKFYQIADMHKTAKQTSYIQAGTWGATGACYGIYAASGAQFKAIDYISKIGATAFLGWFYFEKAKRHDIIQKIVQKTGDQFNVKKGECHPQLEPNCYCRFTERANDPVCIPKTMRDRATANSRPTGCVDSVLKDDQNCECLKTNSCFNVSFNHLARLNGLPIGSFQNTMAGFNGLTRGLASADLFGGNSYLGNSARVKRQLAELMKKAPKSLGKNPLTSEQQKSAKLLTQAGIPLRLARHLAARPKNDKLKKSLFGNNRYRGRYSRRPRNRGKTAAVRSADYERGQTIGTQYRSRKTTQRRGRRRRVGSVDKNQVLRFGQRAQANSHQIREDKSVPLWKIISIRYQKTRFGK